jgi:hypothetical protein
VAVDIRSFDDLVTLLSDAIDAAEAAQVALLERSGQSAEADRDYKVAYARAFTEGHGDTVRALEVAADGYTAEKRYAAKLEENLRVAALENVRTKRTVLTAVQTLTNAWREEVGLARQGGPQ